MLLCNDDTSLPVCCVGFWVLSAEWSKLAATNAYCIGSVLLFIT